jgi:hypothetical protein
VDSPFQHFIKVDWLDGVESCRKFADFSLCHIRFRPNRLGHGREFEIGIDPDIL